MKTKACPDCGQTKVARMFYKNKRTKSGLMSRCKKCADVKSRSYFQANRERLLKNARQRALARKWGMTPPQLQMLIDRQDNKCDICHKEFDNRPAKGLTGKHNTPHVDHDHATGYFRALLCSRCNWALGLWKDDPVHVRAAAEYLERHTNA